MALRLGAGLLLFVFLTSNGFAQESDAAFGVQRLQLTTADRSAPAGMSHSWYHLRPANTKVAKTLSSTALSAPRPKASVSVFPSAQASIAEVPPPGFYPADLSYFGGPVVSNALSHSLFLNCAESCWGNPTQFLVDLNRSTLIHVIDQYVGTTATRRYPVGRGANINETIFGNTVGQNDLLAIVHAGAKQFGAGYGNIYHVFLPKGVDTCFDQTSICYSPDNPASFFFCAYHGSVDFSDVGHVLYTIEPFQNVEGCAVTKPSPNGRLADSTDSSLSHELIETITDPDGTGWFSVASAVSFGFEVADICVQFSLTSPFFDPPVIDLNGKPYKVQLEYSNVFHACANTP